jgi:cyclomaltodextrin glucanotransferase
MVQTPASQFSPDQYKVDSATEKVEVLIQTPPSDTEIGKFKTVN